MKLVGGFIAITVAIVMIAGVFVPAVSDGLTNVGDPVEFEQQGSINASFEMGKVDREIIIDFVEGGLKVGDVTYTNLSGITYWTPFVYSDYAQCLIRSQNDAIQFNVYENQTSVTTNLAVGDRITVTPTTVTLSGSASKVIETGNVYSIGSKSADKVTVIDMGDRNNYILPLINSINDIVCVGFYGTGDLDTIYSVIDGVAKVEDGYTASLNYNFQLKDGTTDIYEIDTFKVVVSDGTTTEEFVPYFALVPSKVVGHADSGASYSVLSATIPIFIVVVLVASIALIRSRSD